MLVDLSSVSTISISLIHDGFCDNYLRVDRLVVMVDRVVESFERMWTVQFRVKFHLFIFMYVYEYIYLGSNWNYRRIC